MATPAEVPPTKPSSWSRAPRTTLFGLPPRWLQKYDDFVTRNASQVSQIESALRSLTYVIPGRFRDAEIASETIHSSVQLLSLYHDTLLLRALSLSKLPGMVRTPSLHDRYTRFWTQKSALYRRVALVLQVVQYTELLCEMAAKRRGERVRWRVVVLIEAIKALCRLLLLRITRSRPIVSPPLPERQPIPEPPEEEDEETLSALTREGKEGEEGEAGGEGAEGENGEQAQDKGLQNGAVAGSTAHQEKPLSHSQEWSMPRTGMSLPALPQPGDISSYLLSRVLTADDIRPATRLLNQLQGSSQAAEVLHILAPLAYAITLAYSSSRRSSGETGPQGSRPSWVPWVIGLGMECAARQLRDRSLRATALERDEWARRGWAMGWWAMRGAFYESVTKGVVAGVRARMPGFVAGILEDYEYLWENYYFSTSP